MENCIDIRTYNTTTLFIIKQPGSVRHTQSGEAITKIEMTLTEARELAVQLIDAIADHAARIHSSGL